MRVAFLSMEYPPETAYGGIGTYVQGQARALAARGHEVHVISCVRGQVPRDYDDRGVSVHRRPAPNPFPLNRLMSRRRAAFGPLVRMNATLACAIELHQLGIRPDVVEAPDWYGEGLLPALAGSHPVVVHLHSPWHCPYPGTEDSPSRPSGLSGWAGERLERAAARRADLVTSPSLQLIRRVRSGGWLGSTPGRLRHHTVDIDKWAGTRPAEESRPVILAVGTLQTLKGQSVLIEAAARLRDRSGEVEVVLAGRSAESRNGRDYADVLADSARRHGVKLVLAGAVAHDDLVDLYSRARVVAVPSWQETLSMAGLEAMASGRPLVCTSNCGVSELISESPGSGQAAPGAVVEPGDPSRLAAALEPYLTNPGLAGRAGTAGRAIVAATCSPEVVGAEAESIYGEVVASGRRRRRSSRRGVRTAS